MSFSISWNDYSENADNSFYINTRNFEILIEKSIKSKNNLTHIFIEGDNYPSLKLLQKEFEGKIDLIYTDPPYNTGKAFTYSDSMETAQWLSFMSRRLKMARTMLKETGCIFIAIGAEQVHLLRILCDQIFGEENFINDFMWLHGKGKKDSWSRTMQQSNLCYAKNKKKLAPFSDTEETDWATKNPDKDSRGAWFSGSISFDEKRSNPKNKNYYEIVSPSGIHWKRQWLISSEEMQILIDENRIYWGKAPEYSNVPREKIFNGQVKDIIPKNIIFDAQSTRSAQKHVDDLLGEKNCFDNPKPVDLIRHFIQITGMKKDITVMDIFAGSGSTFEAVMEQNETDGGKRRCILIQKPEEIKKESKYKTISELCYERVKAVLKNKDDGIEYRLLKT